MNNQNRAEEVRNLVLNNDDVFVSDFRDEYEMIESEKLTMGYARKFKDGSVLIAISGRDYNLYAYASIEDAGFFV
jgi:intein-encoded DNA endonuclease-like protein